MKPEFEILLKMLGKFFKPRGCRIFICLVLLAFGIRNSEIKEKLGTSYDSLRKYKAALESGEIEKLFVTQNADSRAKSELEQYDTQIMEEFDKNPPATIREAQERIHKMTGIWRGHTRIRAYLKKRGLKPAQ
jgi:transposase